MIFQIRCSQDTSFRACPVGFETAPIGGCSFNDSTFYEVTLDMDCSITNLQVECDAEHVSEHTLDICSIDSKVDCSHCDCVSEWSLKFCSDQSFCDFDADSDSLQSFKSSSTYVIATPSGCNNSNVSNSNLIFERSQCSPLNDSLGSHLDFDQFDNFLQSLYDLESNVSKLETSINKMQEDSVSEEECNYTLDELIDSILHD